MNFLLKQKGFSIVELMVALLLGLFLVSGVTAMYISSKQSYRVTDNLSRLQESMRFSLDFLSRDIRMAGYMPCRYPTNITNAITNSSSTWFLDFFNFGIRGYEGGNSTFPPEILSDAVTGTDAIAILKGGLYSASVGSHNSNTITLQSAFPNDELEVGEVAIVCDPRQASIFQISSRDDSAGTISYGNNGPIYPGNATTSIGSYGNDALLTPYEPIIYFIAPSTQNPSVNSLKKRYLQARLNGTKETAVMWEEELLEGVDSMQIMYGVDTDSDQIVNRYVTANIVDSSFDWQDVITVRIGLLMSTGEEVAAEVDNNSYNVAGTVISDTSTPSHPADKKLRYVTNTTINLRNRVQ